MPVKAALFYGILTRFRLRGRTSMLASFSLTNYSEFGLIVASVGVTNGWLGSDWLMIIAISLSITFVLAAPLNSAEHRIYAKFSHLLKPFETDNRLPEDKPIQIGGAEVAIIGMGGIGTSAYDEMMRRHGKVIIGVDFCEEDVEHHRKMGRNVLYGDAADSDFWERFEPVRGSVSLVMLALPDLSSNIFAIRQMNQRGFQGRIMA